MPHDPKILLVEDEATIRYVAERQFKALGFPISDVAEDGTSAVEKATNNDYDLIFMDIRLPDFDGIEATKKIKAAGKQPIIIGMTAFAYRKECLDVGMKDFLQKPVLLAQLKEVLDRWVAHPPDETVEALRVVIPGPENFRHTESQLSDLKTRIDQLRKKVGLSNEQ